MKAVSIIAMVEILFGAQLFICNAQPAFTTVGEIRVIQSGVSDRELGIAVRPNGESWVTWIYGSQLFDSDLKPIGSAQHENTITSPHAISDTDWCYISMAIEDRSFRWIYRDIYSNYYLLRRSARFLDTLALLEWVQYYVCVNNGQDADGEFFGVTVSTSTNGSLINFNTWVFRCLISFHDSYTTHVLVSYDKNQRICRTINKEKIERPFSRDAEQKNESMISPSFGGKVALLIRIRADIEKEKVIPNHYYRWLSSLSISGDALSQQVWVDSVTHQNADHAERVLLGYHNDAYLFRRKRRGSDSIFVRRASFDGSIKTNEQMFISRCANSDMAADYRVANLSGNRILAVWTDVDPVTKKTNVMTACFDENLQMIAVPKRVNSDTAGNHHSVSLAMKGDSAYVVWLDTRNKEQHIYLRMFVPDQILDVPTIIQPTAFRIESIYPNPMIDQCQVRLVAPNGGMRVRICLYDLLGRTVKRVYDGEISSGSNIIQFNRENLPAGVYNLVLTSEQSVDRIKIVVL